MLVVVVVANLRCTNYFWLNFEKIPKIIEEVGNACYYCYYYYYGRIQVGMFRGKLTRHCFRKRRIRDKRWHANPRKEVQHHSKLAEI